MSLYGWALLAAVAVLFAGIGAYLYWRWRRLQIPWQPLPGYHPGAQYAGAVAPPRLVECLWKAEAALLANTKWKEKQLARVGSLVKVQVLPVDEWVDVWGRKIAGTQVGEVLVVGLNLKALCHELAHLCESVLDGEVDEGHLSWTKDGIVLAVTEYELFRSQTARPETV